VKRSTTSAISQRETYHHGDLRQSLIDAAIALIQSGKMSQLSLREVARQVGVSHNAPYRHFQDKDALLSAVAEQGFQRLRIATEQALDGTNAVQRLGAIGQAYVEFAIQNPAYYRVMFSLPRTHQEEALKNAIAQSSAVLLTVIQEGQATGVFRADDTDSLVQIAWAFVHGIAMLAIDHQLPAAKGEGFQAFLQFSTQTLIEGFLSKQEKG